MLAIQRAIQRPWRFAETRKSFIPSHARSESKNRRSKISSAQGAQRLASPVRHHDTAMRAWISGAGVVTPSAERKKPSMAKAMIAVTVAQKSAGRTIDEWG